jgi:hypothetical protein
MYKKITIVLTVLVMLGVATTAALAEGPPWPAMVITPEDEACWMFWSDSDGNPFAFQGSFMGVYQEKNGNWKMTCQYKLDFDDPGVATIDQFCEYYPFFCKQGSGSVIIPDFGCSILLPDGEIEETSESLMVINPSGNYNVTCHFRANQMEP